ncbi:uncharacterized protein EDB91DRAFT_1085097 [Suillus paluster]|uniref:uncharacterized protein n=1 Tax=Suillus paluster TaxID=48578 RepID=UPI001B85D5C8|nr:uncharacterized protein EDB91DRAFT_1085097 [Suillus paluster]KAG1731337.1 hypothetical protein EDB91DRAFT_1085097 [Suillus paluster]
MDSDLIYLLYEQCMSSTMDIASVFSALNHNPELKDLSCINFQRLLRCASALKDDVLQPQPHMVSVIAPPDILPPIITEFLSDLFHITLEAVDMLWDVVKDIVWVLPTELEEREAVETMFCLHGKDRGLTALVLYPPNKTCINAECNAQQCGSVLKKEEQCQIVVFTQAEDCATRTTTIIMLSDQGLGTIMEDYQVHCNSHDQDWQFKTSPTTEEVWDTFILLALLNDHECHSSRLRIPHDQYQKDRYTIAMHTRNEHIITHGQYELPHACHGCMRIFHMPDGMTHYTKVVVTDGVTVGRPCCAVPHCKNSLESTRHRFCSADPNHKQRETMCAVEGCDKLVAHDDHTGKYRKACANPVHLKMEDMKAVSTWSGKSKMQRTKTAKLNDALTSTGADEDALPVQDIDEWYNHNPSTGNVSLVQASSSSSTGVVNCLPLTSSMDSQMLDVCPDKDEAVKLKATFFWQRTNNEQLFICPCGVISGRGTMYHHEAVSNVLVLFEKIFSLPHARKPQHLIYDSNCNALREVESRKIKFFEGMGMCVDAFHHKTKHKASDTFCQQHCDMKAYPELLDE